MKEHIWMTPQEVGILVGFSASFIRLEIRAQQLPAQWIASRRCAGQGRWKIHRDDAIAYAVKLGVWKPTSLLRSDPQ